MIRRGDTFEISGSYQHRARTDGLAVQRFWHAEKERIIRAHGAPRPGNKVLDVGCGSGVITDLLASMGADALGIDANPQAIAYAQATFTRPTLHFRQGLVEDLPDAPESFDGIYCLEVLEHLFENQATDLLARFARLLRPGGHLLLTTPNYRGLWPALEFMMDRLHLAPTMANHQHVTRLHRRRLRDMLAPADWDILRLHTFSTLAPFLSILHWGLAERIARLEDRVDLPFGHLLLLVAQRRGRCDHHD
jgi:2-polyprenyl-3-methyl-5-hydroxy-6-metoxy-1,4-benzoquinol methylase